ncbi:MAG: peptidase M10 [Flavobacteriaceae bacterium]|nr:peptidase M10 [Flavobacteriaceae bacterium]
MKTKFKFSVLVLITLFFAFTSCEENETNESALDAISNQNTDEGYIINVHHAGDREIITDQSLLETIHSLDIDVGTASIGVFHLPDGSTEERIYIGDDITFTVKELNSLKDAQSRGSRQYRTFNLVTGSNRNIDIIGYVANGSSFSLSNKAQQALQNAVNNYNSINTTLQFNLTFGSNWQSKDMVIYDNSINNPNSQGGVAGFPTSNGEPHQLIQIYNLENFSTDVNEHVITHEIGHAVGFRHSDWFDRLSCPPSAQGNEGSGSNGAVHIPGTPTGRDVTAVMQACFSTSEDGEFNGNDIIALEAMYPTTSGSICDGVSEWQSGVNYPIGSRVTYFGNLYERVTSGWTFIGPC